MLRPKTSSLHEGVDGSVVTQRACATDARQYGGGERLPDDAVTVSVRGDRSEAYDDGDGDEVPTCPMYRAGAGSAVRHERDRSARRRGTRAERERRGRVGLRVGEVRGLATSMPAWASSSTTATRADGIRAITTTRAAASPSTR